MGDQITENFKETHIPQQHWVEGIPFPRVLVAGPAFSQTSSTQPPAQAVGEAVGRHKEWVESLLHSSGAVLFRGFPIHTAQDFNDVVVAFGYEELPYVGGAAPRTNVVGRVFTSNESPPDQPIPFHHEMAQVPEYPAKLFFYCEVEPAIGGETPIVPSHLIYKRMAEKFPDFVKKLEETGLLYIRILGEDDDPSSPIGRGWHSTFLTKDKDEAEKRSFSKTEVHKIVQLAPFTKGFYLKIVSANFLSGWLVDAVVLLSSLLALHEYWHVCFSGLVPSQQPFILKLTSQ